jgi:hypothetical protein
MNENYFEPNINIVEDSIIVLLLSFAITYLVFTIMEYYKPKTLVDLGQSKYLI